MLGDKKTQEELKILIRNYIKVLLEKNCSVEISLTDKEFEDTVEHVFAYSDDIFEYLDNFIFDYLTDIGKIGDE